MSLTQGDLQQIRGIVEEVVEQKTRGIVEDAMERHIAPLRGELQALRNDIKEIYDMIAELQRGTVTDTGFAKLTIEEKLFRLNAELLAAAKQAGITLPR